VANEVDKVAAPALPLAQDNYNRSVTDQFNNILRLFFRRLTNVINEILSTEDGGKVLYMPRGLFYSTTGQTAVATNTGYPVEFENSSDVTIWTWINKNGTDVSYGGQKQTIKGNGDQAIYWNFSIDLTAGQYIEMYWATSDTALSLHTEAATSPHPGVPSTIVAVSFVSNL
jgi:hypothetical protein